jgi:2,3-bisphosphoglycerate-independent phosphoglycerate mutase
MIGEDFKETRIKKNDAVIFYNFRIDRPRQLTQKIIKAKIENLFFVTMTKYHDDFNLPVIFPDNPLPNTLGEVIANAHLGQLRASESEKERFVTYYFNGLKENAFKGEDRLIVPSPKIATYDLQPEMSTKELIDKFSNLWNVNRYTLGVINIACPDMVAHTGMVDKTILAIKAADQALKDLVELTKNSSSYLLITGDHGNAEDLSDTKHSTAPVPLILYSDPPLPVKLDKGVLGDIAPTILDLLGIEKPKEMSGQSLIIR